MLHLPKMKTRGQGGDDIYLISPSFQTQSMLLSTTSPLLHKYQKTPSFFMWQSADGSWCPMTKTWFMDSCRAAWKKEGLDLLDGHSFWIGGMTHHLMSGVDLWLVMVISCWSLNTCLTYWRKVEEILLNFISEAYDVVKSLTAHMSWFIQNMALG